MSGRLATVRAAGSSLLAGSLVVAAFTAWGSRSMSTDGWLSLAGGREIVRSGLPTRNRWTVIGYGRDWVDQQWLAQLALYAVHWMGGIALLVALNVLLAAGTYVWAMVVAGRRGASTRSVTTVALVALLPYFATASFVRTQTLAYPLFIGVLAAATSVRSLTARRVVLLLALLVVWANIHGSVLLGAALVAGRGLAALLHDRRRRSAWLALVGAPLSIFCSPYGSALVGYYDSTAFNGTFGKFLAQWAPTRLGVVSAPVFALVLAVVWLSGRFRADDRFGRAVLLAACLVALLAVRNWPWFTLAAVTLMPSELDRVWRRRETPSRSRVPLGALVGMLLCLAALVACVSSFSRVLKRTYPVAAASDAAAAARTHPRAHVFATTRLADWLLWKQPELAGRLETDARYELLRSDELEDTVLFTFGSGVDRFAARDHVFVLDPTTDHRAISALRKPRFLFRSSRVVVAVVPPVRR